MVKPNDRLLMEHEVANHAKKIYRTVKSPKHKFGEKITTSSS